jgi:hypothetical protein
VSDKVRKAFLLLLSATAPGEIVAARDALVRLALAEKRDVHMLADVLTLRGDAGKPPSPCEMATHCWDMFEQGARLSEKEQKFVNEMRTWAKPSPKQIDWLTSIYGRMKGT